MPDLNQQFEQAAKYGAWEALQGTAASEAKEEYIRLVRDLADETP